MDEELRSGGLEWFYNWVPTELSPGTLTPDLYSCYNMDRAECQRPLAMVETFENV